ncbi:MAG: Yip1 family protein [candidate division Zixibacteria bacterium]|nr:Yip1 family protein [candidate division Zixibacteria bacterium]
MNLVERAKNILLAPAKEWEVIKGEPLSTREMYTKYAMILAAIPAVAGFIGRSFIGYNVWGVVSCIPVATGLTWAVVYYILSLVGVYLLGFIIDSLAPSFGAKKDMNGSLKVAIFSSTALWVVGIFYIIPILSILAILGLYSLYLLYGGMKTIKEPPQDKLVGYYIVTLIAGLVLSVIISVVVTALVLGGYGAMGGMRGY